MGRRLRSRRWLGLMVGLALSLGGVTLFAQGPAPADGPVVGNKGTKTYHRPTCAVLKRTAAKNKVELASAAEAEAQGYRACGICKPAGDDTSATPKAGGIVPRGKGMPKKGPSRPTKSAVTAKKG